MADLFDRYTAPSSTSGDLFDRYNAPAKPQQTMVPGKFGIDPSYVGTRLTNIASGFAGLPRMGADLIRSGANMIGVNPDMAIASNPITAVGQIMPSSEDIKRFIHDRLGAPERNTPGEAGKILDAAVEGGMGGVLAGPSTILPSIVGSAASQGAGDIPGIKGTKYEPLVRAGTALLAGGGTGLAQNVAGTGLRVAKNALALGAPEDSAANILGRALTRDEMTAADLKAPALGQPLVIGGGENVKGALRGSIAAPGQARTTVNNALDSYLSGGDARANVAIDQNISNLPPLSTRTNALATDRAAAAGPAYEAAGIPDRVFTPSETVTPGPVTTRQSSILDYEGKPVTVSERGPDVVTKNFNTPTINDSGVQFFLENSPDVKAAIAAARRLPDFKDLPANSMVMLDKAYKHLNGMEQEAIRTGNGTRAFDLHNLRTDFKNALTTANPAYGEALAAYSEPSELMDAAKLGSDVFRKNVNAEEVARNYGAMPADQKKEFLGGVADYLRTRIGNSDRGVAAERIWNGSNVRDRLRAILPSEEFNAFATAMSNEKLAADVSRQVTQGSRTVPMGLEAADNASQTAGILGDLGRGRFLSAGGRAANALAGRLVEGRTEAVNNVLADWLTATDPEKIGLVKSLAERARLHGAARAQGRFNALTYGPIVPALYGASQGGER